MDEVNDILVPVDMSLGSRAAAQAAVALAKRYPGAKIHFLHVYEYTPVVSSDVMVAAEGGRQLALNEYIREQSSALFDEFVQSVDGLDQVEWTRSLVRGTPNKMIVQRAGEDHCDLVVMGTHGRTGVSHFLLGSVAERVVQKAPVPVLVVRGTA